MSTPGNTVDPFAVEEAARRFVMEQHAPSLGNKRVQFPKLVRNAEGRVVETGEVVEREVVIRDHKWMNAFEHDRQRLTKELNEARELMRRRLATQELDEPASTLRELVYLQDEQMYSTTPFLFQTDCPWSVQELAQLTWKEGGWPGRFSVSFWEFCNLLLCQGFRCKLSKQFPEGATPLSGYEIVVGATGNY